MRRYLELICRWVSSVMDGNLAGILRGNLNRILGREGRLYRRRMRICSHCPLNECYRGIGRVCARCGCPLESKLRDRVSYCPEGRWDKETA